MVDSEHRTAYDTTGPRALLLTFARYSGSPLHGDLILLLAMLVTVAAMLPGVTSGDRLQFVAVVGGFYLLVVAHQFLILCATSPRRCVSGAPSWLWAAPALGAAGLLLSIASTQVVGALIAIVTPAEVELTEGWDAMTNLGLWAVVTMGGALTVVSGRVPWATLMFGMTSLTLFASLTAGTLFISLGTAETPGSSFGGIVLSYVVLIPASIGGFLPCWRLVVVQLQAAEAA